MRIAARGARAWGTPVFCHSSHALPVIAAGIRPLIIIVLVIVIAGIVAASRPIVAVVLLFDLFQVFVLFHRTGVVLFANSSLSVYSTQILFNISSYPVVCAQALIFQYMLCSENIDATITTVLLTSAPISSNTIFS